MRSIEASAKTRQEAIQKGLDSLRVDLSDVEIEILDEGSRGLFGFGARDVRVKVTAAHLPDLPAPKREREERPPRGPRPPRQERPRTERPPRPERQPKEGQKPQSRQQQPQPKQQPKQEPRQRQPKQAKPPRKETPKPPRQQQARPPRPPRPERPPREQAPRIELPPLTEEHRDKAVELLREMIAKMGIEATVNGELTDSGGVRLGINSADSAILIGHKGRNLQSMQYLINRMVRAEENEMVERIYVDVEDYVERRRQNLEDMAVQLAAKAKETRREIRVKPLSPQERRIIHLLLKDDPEIRTFSIGTGSLRQVVISPKSAKADGRGKPRPKRGPSRGGRGRRSEETAAPETTESAVETSEFSESIAPEIELAAAPIETTEPTFTESGGQAAPEPERAPDSEPESAPPPPAQEEGEPEKNEEQ